MAGSQHRVLLAALLAVGIAPVVAYWVTAVATVWLAPEPRTALIVLLATGALFVVSGAAFAWRMAAALSHPIDQLRESAALMRGPNRASRAGSRDPDLAEIAGALNALADRAEAAERKLDERLATVAQSLAVERLPLPDALPAPDADLHTLSFAVLDLETTGLDAARGDTVVSMACVRVRGGQVSTTDRFVTLIDPERAIPPASTRVHGIDDAAVQGAPTLAEALPKLGSFVGESVLVGHVVGFDLAFLEPALQAVELPSLARHGVLDTLLLGHVLFPASRPTSLEDLTELLGVDLVGRHTALGDAATTAECFARMLVLLDQRGLRTLADVLALQRPSAWRRVLTGLLTPR
jgi:DNA polymerase III epsilon subunit family exonuclease